MKRLADIKIPRSGFALAYVKNQIYAIAGSTVIVHTPIANCEIYDIEKD